MTVDKTTKRAMRAGRSQAVSVIDHRTRILRRREKLVVKQRRGRAAAGTPLDAKLRAAAGSPSVAVLVAEGDSWFDYPFVDVLSLLEDEYGYDVESVAHKGDRVEEMAYDDGQLDEFTRRIEKLLRHGSIPRAILLSGGGNDIAGGEFGMLLDHVMSAKPGLNDQVVAGIIDERVRLAYAFIISAVTKICELRLGRRIPIIVHGYDYAVPDGRGFFGGWQLLPGPWLQPGFRQKGFADLAQCTALVAKLIDRFNDMLKGLVHLPDFSHVRHVDLRGVLPNGPGYKQFWDNELHPTKKGFGLVTEKFATALASLPAP